MSPQKRYVRKIKQIRNKNVNNAGPDKKTGPLCGGPACYSVFGNVLSVRIRGNASRSPAAPVFPETAGLSVSARPFGRYSFFTSYICVRLRFMLYRAITIAKIARMNSPPNTNGRTVSPVWTLDVEVPGLGVIVLVGFFVMLTV